VTSPFNQGSNHSAATVRCLHFRTRRQCCCGADTEGLDHFVEVVNWPSSRSGSRTKFVGIWGNDKTQVQPLYTDHFMVQGNIIWFTRDKNGKVDRLHVGASRMRDMPFVRVK
jgi:hypothetical protein